MSDERRPLDCSDVTAFLGDARRNLTVVRMSFGLHSQRFRDMQAVYREIAHEFKALPAYEALLQEVCTTNGEGLHSSK